MVKFICLFQAQRCKADWPLPSMQMDATIEPRPLMFWHPTTGRGRLPRSPGPQCRPHATDITPAVANPTACLLAVRAKILDLLHRTSTGNPLLWEVRPGPVHPYSIIHICIPIVHRPSPPSPSSRKWSPTQPTRPTSTSLSSIRPTVWLRSDRTHWAMT